MAKKSITHSDYLSLKESLKVTKRLFHYTSLNSFWEIIEGDSLRATQARFSNDDEELNLGASIIAEVCDNVYNEIMTNSPVDKINAEKYKVFSSNISTNKYDIDSYIVCFSKEENILSQWRGYCRNDGVCIGFDFDLSNINYKLKGKKSDNEKQNNTFTINLDFDKGMSPPLSLKDISLDKNKSVGDTPKPIKVSLYDVWYVSDNSDKNSSNNIIDSKTLKVDLTNKLNQTYLVNTNKLQTKKYIDGTIPLIKHSGFVEEAEVRMVINNEELEGTPFNKYINYYKDKGMQYPSVNIEFTSIVDKEPDKLMIKIFGMSDKEYELTENFIIKLCKLNGIDVECVKCCDASNEKYILLSEKKNLQKKVFQLIDTYVRDEIESINGADDTYRYLLDTKIWCDGHLPIRSIMVSPCDNQNTLYESICHYIQHNEEKYWLKYVDVTKSDIPFRRPK